MKRPVEEDDDRSTSDDKKMKKVKPDEDQEGAERSTSVLMDENLLYEVLKYVDAQTLATAACVSKQWHLAAYDERLWELICTRHTGYGSHQLRSVVLALGGFRRQALYLWNLSKTFFFLLLRLIVIEVAVPPAAAAGGSGEICRLHREKSMGKGRGSPLAVSSLYSVLRGDEFH
ncbi:F-box family protein [Actinidia rufa]|uniref:F-box family protein n=1 Tax=Actinidia rufa TaxID=165716 RepID=A0A7J0GHG6_9ERIC|nr:F-box family protein [Actinidia rufa]